MGCWLGWGGAGTGLKRGKKGAKKGQSNGTCAAMPMRPESSVVMASLKPTPRGPNTSALGTCKEAERGYVRDVSTRNEGNVTVRDTVWRGQRQAAEAAYRRRLAALQGAL